MSEATPALAMRTPMVRKPADGVADCRGFVLIEDGAHLLSRTRLEPINFDLHELSEALALTTLGFDIPSLAAN